MVLSGILNLARPWIGRRLSRAIGRAVCIHGDLSIAWRRLPRQTAKWRVRFPLLHLRAQDIVLGHPPWAPGGGSAAHVGQLDIAVRLLPLLRGTVDLPLLILTELHLDLPGERFVCMLGKERQPKSGMPRKRDEVAKVGRIGWRTARPRRDRISSKNSELISRPRRMSFRPVAASRASDGLHRQGFAVAGLRR